MWNNADNRDFYENVPVEALQEFIITGGLRNNIDLELAYPAIQKSANIIEIGAAYGRVIDFLLEKKFKGSITAVERSKSFYDHLKQKYDDNIDLIHADIEDLNFKDQFAAVLFFWSSLSEWPPEQQLATIKKLLSWVQVDGFLVLELFGADQAPLNSTSCKNQLYEYKSSYGTAVGYTPNQEEMKKYLELLEYRTVVTMPYQTDTGRNRCLYLIQR